MYNKNIKNKNSQSDRIKIKLNKLNKYVFKEDLKLWRYCHLYWLYNSANTLFYRFSSKLKTAVSKQLITDPIITEFLLFGDERFYVIDFGSVNWLIHLSWLLHSVWSFKVINSNDPSGLVSHFRVNGLISLILSNYA